VCTVRRYTGYWAVQFTCYTTEERQRRATKLVIGLKRLEYADRLNALGLTTLEKRRVSGDLIETFRIVTGRDKVKMEDF